MRKKPFMTAACFLALAPFLVASVQGEDETVGKAVPVTVTKATRERVLVTEETIGRIEARTAPLVAAEVEGRIVKVFVDTGQKVKAGKILAEMDSEAQRLDREAAQSEVSRLQALLVNQELTVTRLRDLLKRKSISTDQLDNAEAQLKALKEQLEGATARLSDANRRMGKTLIYSPVTGRIEERYITVGDFLKVGNPLFRITTDQSLRVLLPFPESIAAKLRTGLPVRLTSPMAPDTVIESSINDVQPSVDMNSRAIEVTVDITNPGSWKPGASVNGTIIVAEHPDALTVPEQSVVRRPAGEVVYAIEQGKARQREVKTGQHREGRVEILEGIAAGDLLAVDGAGFLTDGANVRVQETNP
jgi:membrane fusion protein (multidrug efflux system)